MNWYKIRQIRIGAIALCTAALVQFTISANSGEPSLRLNSIGGVRVGNIEYRTSETAPDAKLERAILRDFLTDYTPTDPENYLRYYYNRIDLNGDNQPEVVVYLVGSYVCGSGGCNALIYTTVGQDYQLLSKHTLVNPPILVTPQRTSGWKNLVFMVGGGGVTPGYRLMRFNGRSYPLNPSVQPAVRPNTTLTGIGLLSDTFASPGIKIKPR
ncbi:hypothetical protein ACE1CD_33680 [Aerosakkonema sp. BLCC-F183]|uniref:hypothetical protein n=1 Tax=Aerosakkonema sp. BLCC-F183 TaxID=3342834 RepID=UPI0035B8A574